MFGLLVELGPLLLNDDSLTTADYKKTGVPTLFRNDFSWTKVGSVLMFDWPPPVGFSYCNDPTGKGNACGPWDDERMAKISYAALAGWFASFPERQANPLYLTGESCAPKPSPCAHRHHRCGQLSNTAASSRTLRHSRTCRSAGALPRRRTFGLLTT